jgi:LPS-assembly protein
LTYEQPYFYAPKPNWDIEIDPQVRWKRGAGGYITARFVDSNHSSGYIRAGYFKNKDSYANSNHLNGEHKGVELLYQSTDFLNMESYKSGLYINGTGLNDREYLNLQKGSVATLVNSNLVESRFNSFIYDNANYFGLYGKYNIDISRESNSETIQELPSIQYHRYMQKLFDSSLFYSFDMRLLNSTREKGSRATQTQIDLPVTYYNSFFNNYLDISISENIYLDRVDFSNIDSEYKNYYYFYRNYHKFNISSDLVKRYDGYSHTVHPEITYIVPSRQVESPTSYEDLNSERQELFVTNTQEEQLSIGLGQYLFDENSNMNLMHTIKYSHYPKRTKSKGDIVNEFEYKLENITFYNNLKYAWDEEELHSLTTSLLYNQNKYDIMLMHFYNNDFLFTNKKTSFLQSKVMHRFGERDSWFVNFDYDLRQEYNHQWSIGWSHTQKCWSSKLSLGQEVVPNLDSSFRNTALYIELNLNPIGGIQQNIEDSFSSQGVDR